MVIIRRLFILGLLLLGIIGAVSLLPPPTGGQQAANGRNYPASDTLLTDNGATLTYAGTGGISAPQLATTGTGPLTFTGAPGTCGTSASGAFIFCISSTGNRPVYGYNTGANYNLVLFSDLPTTQYGILYSGGSNVAPSQIAACGANFPVIGQASAAPICSTIAYPSSLTSGALLYASSTTGIATGSLITANVLIKSGGAGTAPAASTITDNGTDVLMTEPLIAANSTFGASSGNTAATTGWTSLSLAMPSIPISSKVHGTCTLVWQASSTSYTITLGLNTSAAPTDFYINTSQLRMSTSSVVNLLPPAAVTTATTTAVMAATTPSATGTSYTTLVDFTLVTSSSNAVVISVYGEVSNTSETLTLEPQSVCGWLP